MTRPPARRGRPAFLDGHPEVRARLDELLKTGATLDKPRVALVREFGRDRAPGLTVITRYAWTVRPHQLPRRVRIGADPDVTAALDDLAGQPITISGIHGRLLERFGEARAPGRSAVAAYVKYVRRELGMPARTMKLERDAEVRADIEAMIPLVLSVKEAPRRLLERFGPGRAPSSASVAVYVGRRRAELGLPAWPGHIHRDPELRQALDALIGEGFTIVRSHAILCERFGQDRVPSRSALGEYIRRRRRSGHPA